MDQTWPCPLVEADTQMDGTPQEVWGPWGPRHAAQPRGQGRVPEEGDIRAGSSR